MSEILICAANRNVRACLHATRSVRIRDASGAAVDHHSNSTAICGVEVTNFYPFQDAAKVMLLKESRFCVDCADRLAQRAVDAACGSAK